MAFKECNRIKDLMCCFDRKWYIAGGWAIDLFLRRETREHHDIEIAISRKDQLFLKDYLSDWEFQKVSNGVLSIWEDEYLQLPIHEIHASSKKHNDRLEILLNEFENHEWRFRRNQAIRGEITSLTSMTEEGIPYLSPEIVLLYKAKHSKEKDHLDFMNVIDFLDDKKKSWLKEAIAVSVPGHTWLTYL